MHLPVQLNRVTAVGRPFRGRYQFSTLLGLLSVLLVATGALPHATSALDAEAIHWISSIAILLLFTGVLIAASIAVSPLPRTRRVVVGMAAAVIVLQFAGVFFPVKAVEVMSHIVTAGFLGYTIVMILRHLFQTRDVNSEVICASLCAYLLIGVLWAFLFSLTDLLSPAAFHDGIDRNLSRELHIGGHRSSTVFYFSFITLSTLGYGDIVPTLPISQTLAAVEAVTGQLFLAVLVARLVGMHTAQSLERSDRSEGDASERGNDGDLGSEE